MTEWLPISSSGHLVLVQQLMGLDTTIAFDALLHLGTLASVVAYFRRDVAAILRALFAFRTKDPNFRLLLLLILGSIPSALAAIFFLDLLESFYTNMLAVGAGFIATAVILILPKIKRGKRDLGWPLALVMGLFQALAIIPGVSRSGSTISSGLLWGADREKAFKFAFLLSIPAIVGATALELARTPAVVFDMGSLAAAVVTAVVGYAAIRAVKSFITSDRFHLFAAYCLAMGIAVLIYAL